ncbi:hypothetical protein [uncultured Shewanella sp.]|uniref:hypothetical protein n=1 Tax=uncultured Shewanella sp. TaxID=173975 RepID=UPI002612D072|nr:hypothetical protein [uncultured Shewanella sp.]
MGESPEQNINEQINSSNQISNSMNILSGDEPTPEFERYNDALLSLSECNDLEELLSSTPDSEEEQLKVLAKAPDGLKLYDETYTAIAKVFSAQSLLAIKALDIQPDPQHAAQVASSKSLSELFINTKPELEIFLEDFKNRRPFIYIEEPEDGDENKLRFSLLKSALACHFANLPEQSIMFFDQLWERVFGKESPNNSAGREQLLKIKGSMEHFSNAGSKGNQKRHSGNKKTKEAAIKLYLSGEYKNPSQASHLLLPRVKKLAAEFGSTINWELNGQKRLYEWLRTANR